MLKKSLAQKFGHTWSHGSLVLVATSLVLPLAGARNSDAQYRDYARNEGQAQKIRFSEQSKWTLDMEVRGRTEDQTAINNTRGYNQAYELSRIRGGFEVRPLRWASVYMQFHDTHALGLPLAVTASNMRDSFDLRQGYADIHLKPAHFARTQVIAGRQELKIADERVVGASDWADNARSFDGFVLRVGDRNRVEAFTSSVVAVHPTSLDTHGAGLTFHGIDASLTKVIPKTTIVPFVLLRRLPRVLSQQSVYGAENEVTVGTYAASLLPHGFEYVTGGTLQRGSYSNDSIHAGSGYVKGGYTAAGAPWKPRLQAEYDYATGNPHRNPLRIGTNDQIYPSNHNVFGLVDLFGFQNIKQLRGNLEVQPTKTLSLLLQGGSLHLATVRDGVYSSAGSVLVKAPTKGFASDDIGSEVDASAKLIVHRYFVNTVGVGHFFPGAAMTQNGHAAPLTLFYFSVRYRFTLQ